MLSWRHLDFTPFSDHIRIIVVNCTLSMHIISFQQHTRKKKRFIYIFLGSVVLAVISQCRCSHTRHLVACNCLTWARWTWTNLIWGRRMAQKEAKTRGEEINLNFTYIVALIAPTSLFRECRVVNWEFVEREIKNLEQWVSSEFANDLHIIFNNHHQCRFYCHSNNQRIFELISIYRNRGMLSIWWSREFNLKF